MLDEILYLESCLSIEKSMFDITEACAEGLGSIDEGFLFESPKDVFATVRDKIIKLIEKVRNIFAGKASKMQEQTVAKKAENLGDATIEVQDASKVKKLYDKAVTSIKSGKDPDKVNDWFKKGLIALGVLTVAGSAAAVGVTKHKKKIKASQAQKQLQDINKAIIQGGSELDRNSAVTLRYGEKILQQAAKGVKPVNNIKKENAPNVLRQVNGYSELYSNYSKAMSSCRMSVVGGLNAPLKVGKVAVATGKTFESYSYDLFDDDDIFAESYDDYDDIFEESFNDLFDYDDPFDDIHSI